VSARPDVPHLSEEDLDLLVSRSLDGDLSPEEEQQLERLVALDPAAARRKVELAALVADVKALPEPATPFALATRVNANVSERGGRPGALGARVGFYPAPGFAKAALVVLGIVGVSIAILRPAPKRMAEGPVDVLLYSPSRPASPAPQALVAEARPAQGRQEKARDQGTEALAKEKKTVDKSEQASRNEPAEAAASNVVAESDSTSRADRDGGVVSGGAVAARAPAKIAAAAPPAAAAAERAMAAPASRGWTVSVRGDAARLWALRRAPDRTPAPGRTTVYAVTLDANGQVASARSVGGAAAEPGLDEFVRGMVFELLPRAAGALQGRKDAPTAAPAPAEFEIELAPR
jgi:hypothetical protein